MVSDRKAYMASRKAAGRCNRCGGYVDGGFGSCEPCRDVHRLRQAERRTLLRSAGKCPQCGGPSERNGHCLKCLGAGTARAAAYRERSVGSGRCYACLATPLKTKWHCEACAKKFSEKVSARDVAIRRAVIARYGNRCACCGESSPMFLTIDHVNNDGWAERARHSRHKVMPIKVFKALLEGPLRDDLQSLCFNCNFGKNRNGGICPHVQLQNHHPHVTI
jgi:hypothetical protein